MSRIRGCPRAVLAWVGAASTVVVSAHGGAAARVPPARSDVDDVSIAGSHATLAGELVWSHAALGPGTRARLSGRLTADGGCARVQVDWLNSGTGTLASSARSTCKGSERIVLRFHHATLECARVRLFFDDEQTGPTRLVCDGGS